MTDDQPLVLPSTLDLHLVDLAETVHAMIMTVDTPQYDPIYAAVFATWDTLFWGGSDMPEETKEEAVARVHGQCDAILNGGVAFLLDGKRMAEVD